MIDTETARRLLDTIEGYGDAERVYGKERQRQEHGRSSEKQVQERNQAASRALNEVKRYLIPHLEDPHSPALGGLFEVPDRGDEGPEIEQDFPEVKWAFEDRPGDPR